ncbi:acyclic terpene utilization AtuA family protein [Halomarina pelagica]|uniref:acyclic terpene utilization AtuA family protein n=1 Tax=Halomarina pelagica TaxID=2961599 RepID=UPI0020C2DCAF|nr:acyclic terpene utilization AtuA family protein [Halomarina sp. BND7]
MTELRCLSLNGLMHGNGFPTASLDAGLDRDPHFVGVDAGSTDGGPYFLGSGENMHSSRRAVKQVYRTLLTRCLDADVPLLVGSAATAGADVHVDWTAALVREIAAAEGLAFDLGIVYCEQSIGDLVAAIESGRTEPLDESPPLDVATVEAAERVVAMAGPEVFVEALDRGADVVVAGRCSDVAIYKAMAVREGLHEGLATHLAKTIECGGLIATPRGGDCVLGTLTDDAFTVTPTNPAKRTDPLTVASHLLYETADPTRFVEPRGVLHTGDATYDAVDDRTVRVTGSRFQRADDYTVKLEGAREVGHRGVATAGIRDPTAVAELDALLTAARTAVDEKASRLGLATHAFSIDVRVYGRDGVMGGREPTPDAGHEVGLFVEAVAPDAGTVDDLLEEFTYALFVSDFPGRRTTAGNAAFPTSPAHAPVGPAYEFSVWHRLRVADPLDPVRIEVERVGGSA